jgi:hypothetical protein
MVGGVRVCDEPEEGSACDDLDMIGSRYPDTVKSIR